MSFTAIERKKIDNLIGGLCRKHSPTLLRDERRLDYAIDGCDIVVSKHVADPDNQAAWHSSPLATISLDRESNQWHYSFEGIDAELPEQERCEPSADLIKVITLVETGIHRQLME